ncbi:MAG: SCP2 sterol-binding domain-containing protein [Promethearchaeota archaeon]
MENKKKSLKLTDGGMATFFAGMALQYNPNIEPGLEAVLQFNLEDEGYYLVINQDECKAYKGSYREPTMTIITPADIWMKISTGELDGTKAFMKKLFKVEGDMNLLLKLNKIFSESGIQQNISRESQKPIKNLEKLPDHRGPLNISGMTWLNIAFIPWIIVWVWGSISPGIVPQIVAAGIALIITLYHFLTNRTTLFEKCTCIYLILVAIFYGIGIQLFITYSRIINYIFLGGLWLGSLMNNFCLTAEYSRLPYPKEIWGSQAFLKTNDILCAIWGVYFLIMAVYNYFMLIYSELYLILMIISYISLIPMFYFTSWFQKWYPSKMIRES